MLLLCVFPSHILLLEFHFKLLTDLTDNGMKPNVRRFTIRTVDTAIGNNQRERNNNNNNNWRTAEIN